MVARLGIPECNIPKDASVAGSDDGLPTEARSNRWVGWNLDPSSYQMESAGSHGPLKVYSA